MRLLCRWDRALMLHYEVDPTALQPQVPFELDLFAGRAYVSLVAFDLIGMSIAGAPRFVNRAVSAIASNPFLNVRTYVRGGIFFLAEWLNNAPAVLLGPMLYGLPYRWGRLDYHHDRLLHGSVTAGARLAYRGRVDGPCSPATPGSRTAFLMERYTAFTARVRPRLFRVEHEPWPQAEADVAIDDDALIASTGSWFRTAHYAGATYSPGVDVAMTAPEPLASIPPRNAAASVLYSRA